MKLPKYVQAWVDRDGRARCYFRRRGYPLVQLRGLPWSPSFMAEYEKAMSGPLPQAGPLIAPDHTMPPADSSGRPV